MRDDFSLQKTGHLVKSKKRTNNRHGRQSKNSHRRRRNTSGDDDGLPVTSRRVRSADSLERRKAMMKNTLEKANMRVCQKEFSVSVGTRFLGRQDRVDFHFESLCQNDQFGIRDTAKLRFDFGKRATAQIPSENRTAGGEHFLRQFLLITQFSDLRPDNVLQFGHAPKTELDSREASEFNCSDIGAT